MTFSYDADSDVLYVTIASLESAARYVETERGDILRFSTDTNELVGITIPFFEHRTAKGERIAIPDAALHLPAEAVLEQHGSAQGVSNESGWMPELLE